MDDYNLWADLLTTYRSNPDWLKGAWLFATAAIKWIHPVLAEDLPDGPLPHGFVDLRSSGAVVRAKVVIVPDGVNNAVSGQAPKISL